MAIFTEFWPWWLGAIAIASVGVGYFYFLGIPCGVSGIVGKTINWREEGQARTAEMRMANDGAVQEEMMAAALAELANMPDDVRAEVEAELRAAQPEQHTPGETASNTIRLHPAANLSFLLSIIAGAFIAALVAGDWHFTWSMGEIHKDFFGSGLSAWIVLLIGGICVGFGTQMAGGCTMGHGITGNAHLQIGSLLATAAFFGMAVATSFALDQLL